MQIRRATFGFCIVLAVWTGMSLGGPWTIFVTGTPGRVVDQPDQKADPKNENQPAPNRNPAGLYLMARVGNLLTEGRDNINALSTAALAVFTFALWRSTDKLWKAGEAQRIAFDRVSSDQAKAAAESLRSSAVASAAAAKSAEVAERGLTVLERPYLVLEVPTFIDSPLPYRPQILKYVLKNYGRSPGTLRWIEGTIVVDNGDGVEVPLGWFSQYLGFLNLGASEEKEVPMHPGPAMEFPDGKPDGAGRLKTPILKVDIQYTDMFNSVHRTQTRYLRLPAGNLVLSGQAHTSRRMKADEQWEPAWPTDASPAAL